MAENMLTSIIIIISFSSFFTQHCCIACWLMFLCLRAGVGHCGSRDMTVATMVHHAFATDEHVFCVLCMMCCISSSEIANILAKVCIDVQYYTFTYVDSV